MVNSCGCSSAEAMKINRRFFWKLTKWAVPVVTVLVIFLLIFCNNSIKSFSAAYLYRDVTSIPKNKTGLLLGTSKKLPDGRENLYFNYRIDAAFELLQAKKIDYLIISGDNGTDDYNEPRDMKDELVSKGIPDSVIFLDYAGFRTLDAVVRCKEIFSQRAITVISQKFHNERAVYIARHKDIEAIGFEAKDVDKYHGFKTRIREYFARVKVFIDLFLLHTGPRFLGEKIEI
jgi:SanA protein